MEKIYPEDSEKNRDAAIKLSMLSYLTDEIIIKVANYLYSPYEVSTRFEAVNVITYFTANTIHNTIKTLFPCTYIFIPEQ